MEEYFQAKGELLMEGDAYGDMIAAYPAYWSGLRHLELVILMDARVLGRIWPGQIIGRDPQIEEWAADTAPTWGPCRSCCQTWTTSGPYGRKSGLYVRWTHHHEFLTRGQRRGETVEEYFRAKWELLMEGNACGNMIAAYPAYWSGLRRLELVILMDTRVLGRIWLGQIIGRDPQIEEWAADTAPDVGALQ